MSPLRFAAAALLATALAVAIGLAPGRAGAQDLGRPLADSGRVVCVELAGDAARRAGARRVTGRLTSLDDRSLVLDLGAGQARFARAELARVEVLAGRRARGRAVVRATLRGALAGAATGAALGAATYDPDDGCSGTTVGWCPDIGRGATAGIGALLGGAAGALGGVLYGALRPLEVWRPLRPDLGRTGLHVTPGGVGLRVSLGR